MESLVLNGKWENVHVKKCNKKYLNTKVEMTLREDSEDTVPGAVCWECTLCPRVR